VSHTLTVRTGAMNDVGAAWKRERENCFKSEFCVW